MNDQAVIKNCLGRGEHPFNTGDMRDSLSMIYPVQLGDVALYQIREKIRTRSQDQHLIDIINEAPPLANRADFVDDGGAQGVFDDGDDAVDDAAPQLTEGRQSLRLSPLEVEAIKSMHDCQFR